MGSVYIQPHSKIVEAVQTSSTDPTNNAVQRGLNMSSEAGGSLLYHLSGLSLHKRSGLCTAVQTKREACRLSLHRWEKCKIKNAKLIKYTSILSEQMQSITEVYFVWLQPVHMGTSSFLMHLFPVCLSLSVHPSNQFI